MEAGTTFILSAPCFIMSEISFWQGHLKWRRDKRVCISRFSEIRLLQRLEQVKHLCCVSWHGTKSDIQQPEKCLTCSCCQALFITSANAQEVEAECATRIFQKTVIDRIIADIISGVPLDWVVFFSARIVGKSDRRSVCLYRVTYHLASFVFLHYLNQPVVIWDPIKYSYI